ncbi:DNA topoisomerase IV [Muriicola sp. Z0-33]|uniref:DNA topoisomerase IV n=1 Tax=Muriicola sp. Z0-33 TaxID=2816957 RepID=UPI002238863F|nr:DNA topoisomerase IV [Muriicola sp. Z0-33]MCW5516685.1 DNA topoisomerase IV [Muriicola sp. Z0-33]
MQIRTIIPLVLAVLLSGCYQPQRDCQGFKDGTFTFKSIIDGKESTTTFVRNGDLEIDYFNGKADSSNIRWINDCEFVATKLQPKNKAEEQAIHIKILSTTDNSYTFEYSRIGDSRKLRGTAIKTLP